MAGAKPGAISAGVAAFSGSGVDGLSITQRLTSASLSRELSDQLSLLNSEIAYL